MIAFLLWAMVGMVVVASVCVDRNSRRFERELLESAEADEFIAALRDPESGQRPGVWTRAGDTFTGPFVVDGVSLSPALRLHPDVAQRFADAINGYVRESRAAADADLSVSDVESSLGGDR